MLLSGEPDSLARLFEFASLGEYFAERWDFGEYDVDQLTAIAVRYLARCGHKMPEDVTYALRDLLSASARSTAFDAHRLAQQLATTAASRTLTSADLNQVVRAELSSMSLEEGLASVG